MPFRLSVSPVTSSPTVEMLWEAVDPQEALTRRFGFADGGQLAGWVTKLLADSWGVEVISCDRVVMSASNVLVWITTASDRMIVKWSVVRRLFPRLQNVARLTAWLDGRGLPVSAPVPALNGDLQVELGGCSVGLQSVVEGSMLDTDDLAQVHAAGAMLAKLHLGMAEYPHDRSLGPGGQADPTLMRTRVERWLGATPEHLLRLSEWLRRGLDSLPPDATLPVGLVHLDFRSANVLWDRDRVTAILDFEEAGVDYLVNDLAKAAVLLGTRFRGWGPVSLETHATFAAGYRTIRELSAAEVAWLQPLVLWRTLQQVRPGDDHTAWADSAEQILRQTRRPPWRRL